MGDEANKLNTAEYTLNSIIKQTMEHYLAVKK